MENSVIHNSSRLTSLLKNLKGQVECVCGDTNIKISSIEYNSKKVKKNNLFVAVSGFVADGHSFIKDAVSNGANSILVSSDRVDEFVGYNDNGITVLSSENTRKALSTLSSAFFNHPTSLAPVIGVTGTNGKTSITYMIESILKNNGYSPGVIGTVNYRWKDKIFEAPNTTPEAKDLQELFSNMILDGVDFILMEVSSHALKLFRVEDINFDVVIFTNLTRDHLDFHENFKDYFKSKSKIFNLLEKSCKDNKAAIVNVDDEYGRKILDKKLNFSYPIYSFSLNADADYKPLDNSVINSISGINYTLEKPDSGIEIKLNVAGSFHIYNSLCSFAACHVMGMPVGQIQRGLTELKTIPGRFDAIKSDFGFNVIVDYAHTDDAVSKLLHSASELNPGRIITIIGCGGSRDKTKRPIMALAAARNSNWVIFTSDNPRDEDPEDILNDMTQGLTENNFEVMPDREEAIKKAVHMARKEDMIVIAGKGHEDYQIIKGKKFHFDDREIAIKYIDEYDKQ